MPIFKEELKKVLNSVHKLDKELEAVLIDKRGIVIESSLSDERKAKAIGARAPIILGAGGKMCTEVFKEELKQLYLSSPNGEYLLLNVIYSAEKNIEAILAMLAPEEALLGMALHAINVILPQLSKLYTDYQAAVNN